MGLLSEFGRGLSREKAKIRPEKMREIAGQEKINEIQSKCGACFNGDCSGKVDNVQVNKENCHKTYSALGLRPSVTVGPGGGGGGGGVMMFTSSCSSSSIICICLLFLVTLLGKKAT